MSNPNPIDLLFGGMGKLGPGDDADTLHVLHLLPRVEFRTIVDAGCGAGRQTLVLAKALDTVVHAVDSYEPFLTRLHQRAAEAGVTRLIQTYCMDMQEIPSVFHRIDLLWAEGAAYNIGFANALDAWARSIEPAGFAVVSELTWLQESVPNTVRDFFLAGYPDMHDTVQNIAAAEASGYDVLDTYTLPRQAWVDDYYDILLPRAQALVDHPDSSVREFARETVKEIEVFEISGDSYGYVFYVMQRRRSPRGARGSKPCRRKSFP